MADRRICAGYYRRYDGKVVYVVSLATDADTGEEIVIWTTYPFAAVPWYYTSSKKSLCAFVEVNGEQKAGYKWLLNTKISGEAIERLTEEGFRGPVRKRQRPQLDEAYDSRKYQHSPYQNYFRERFVDGLSIRRYADAHQLNRGSVDYQQKRFFSALACLLKERDEAEGTCRLLKPAQK